LPNSPPLIECWTAAGRYGWCNYVEGCRFTSNGIGLHAYNSANNIDVVDCIFEGNDGTGLYASGGAQYNIEGNVLEGNGGPGIIVMGAAGVQIASNYFEKNCQPATASGRAVIQNAVWVISSVSSAYRQVYAPRGCVVRADEQMSRRADKRTNSNRPPLKVIERLLLGHAVHQRVHAAVWRCAA